MNEELFALSKGKDAMKKLFVLACALALFVQVACVSNVKPQNTPAPTAELAAAPTENPTDEPTAVPTEAPTAVPAEEPTPKPTGRPTAPPDVGEMPSFPGAVQLGNLIGGELFPEPGMYFVLNGESDLKYVYDRFGELVTTFGAEDNEYSHWDGTGIYGVHGAPFGYSIERDEMLPNYQRFGDILIQTEYWEYIDENGEESSSHFITDIKKINLEDSDLMKAANEYTFVQTTYAENEYKVEEIVRRAFKVDYAGAIVKIDGKYLILDRSIVYGSGTPVLSLQTNSALIFSESGEVLGELDTSPFGRIEGVFGGKYIIGAQFVPEGEQTVDGGFSFDRLNLYTLSGELVMERVFPLYYQRYYPEDELYITTEYADHLQTIDGSFYNAELERIDEPTPEELYGGERADIYGALRIADRFVEQSELYTGIKDGDGNWLFRIYRPRFANDHNNPEVWW